MRHEHADSLRLEHLQGREIKDHALRFDTTELAESALQEIRAAYPLPFFAVYRDGQSYLIETRDVVGRRLFVGY